MFHLRFVFESGEQLNYGDLQSYRLLPKSPGLHVPVDEVIDANSLDWESDNGNEDLCTVLVEDTHGNRVLYLCDDPSLTGVYVMNDRGQTCDTLYRKDRR
jgi:hypothetical protein